MYVSPSFRTEQLGSYWTNFHEIWYVYVFRKPVYKIRRYAVAQLVEALRYKPEGRGFHSRWCHWNFSLT